MDGEFAVQIKQTNDMNSVLVSRTQMNNVQSTSKCQIQEERHHYDIKSMVLSSSGSHSTNQENQTNSCSSDSDVIITTTSESSPSTTAMRRLYFKTAKLNKTTTTLHQQQPQYVPKVYFLFCDNNFKTIKISQHFFKKIIKGNGDGIINRFNGRNNH